LAGHWKHELLSAYLPAAHSAHGPQEGPAKPALHTQAVTFVEDGSEVELARQAAHAALPAAGL
jgi:hypothetical protein